MESSIAKGELLFAEVDYSFGRKYWFAPLGLEQYLDLTRRAIETRHLVKGDVELINYIDHDDGAYTELRFRIETAEKNLARAYRAVQKVEAEILEVADQAVDEVGQRIADITARVSGWGSESLDGLVDNVERVVSSEKKGRALEQLCSRLCAASWGCFSSRFSTHFDFANRASQFQIGTIAILFRLE